MITHSASITGIIESHMGNFFYPQKVLDKDLVVAQVYNPLPKIPIARIFQILGR